MAIFKAFTTLAAVNQSPPVKKHFLYIMFGLLFFAAGKKLLAQHFPDLPFNHITNRDGLSSNSITCVAEDKQGFIWMGTNNGLNRYEGYRVKQYFHDDGDSSSLVFNNILGMFCDSKDRLWISTSAGISCFLPGKNNFINYAVKLPAPHQLKNNSGARITEAKDGTIWISSQGSTLFKVLDDMTLKSISISIAPFTFNGFVQEGYSSMLADKKGKLWAFCANRLYLLNEQTMQPAQTYDFATQIPRAAINSITEDSTGIFWITTWGSILWKFSPVTGSLQPGYVISIADIKEWYYNNHRWITGTDGNKGLYLFDDPSASFKRIEWNPDDPYSIDGTVFYPSFTDHQNNLWVCTNKGVHYVESQKKVFDIFPLTDPGTRNYQRQTSTVPYSFLEDGNETWVSKRYKSTFLFDSSMHIKKFYSRLYPLSASVNNWRSNAYYFLKRGHELFISTDSGLVVYDGVRGVSTLYNHPEVKQGGDFRTIISLDTNNILIRSVANGVFIFNTTKKQFSRHFTSASGIAAPLNYAFKTSGGEIYLSGDGGKCLTRYLPAHEQFEVINPSNERDYHLLSNRAFGMEEDKTGRLWIASSNGMFVYAPATNRIEQHYTENGKMGTMFRVCIDDYQNIWANGSSGIWCYVATKDKWINFTNQDGLPGNDFEGIIAKKKNGDVVAGLEGSLAVFHPGRLNTITSQPPAVITEANTEEKTILFPLMKERDKSLPLSPGLHSFSVDFCILNYYHAEAIQYYYKLEPLMTDFRANSNGHINFDGLNAGHYILHVKGEDKAGNLFSKEDTLNIDIANWWYMNWWFRILAAVLLTTFITFLVRRHIGAIRNESALKQRIAETEMQALRAQMDPHFIFNSLSSIENFIMKNEKRMASDYLNKFARLIRMILDSSRDELVTITKDMEALQLYIDLEQISFNNKFIYTADIDPVLLNEDYRVPSLLIQPYVENAIVHGLSHSQERNLFLTVTAQLVPDYIKYTIEDNGIGRHKAQQYKQRNKPNHKSVGLKITEDRINMFNRQANGAGTVTITDLYDEHNNPRGTSVTIIIKAT